MAAPTPPGMSNNGSYSKKDGKTIIVGVWHTTWEP